MQIAPADHLAARAARLRRHLAARELDALVVTHLPNVAYLTGFFATAGVAIVTPERLVLIGDGRYDARLQQRAEAWPQIQPHLLTAGASYDEALVDSVETLRGLRIGVEAAHLTVARHRYISRSLAERGMADGLAETEGLVEDLRVVKDDWELERLRDGAARLSTVAKCILPKALGGRTEADVAAEIETELRRAGFERPAFDTIVASGPNAALPHARAGSRRLEDGDLVVLDFGGVLDGYCTDLSRTVVVGQAGDRERQAIAHVIEAQRAAFEAVVAGAPPEAADRAARESLAGQGLADAFTHGTGHGLGLEVHERPRVSRARPGHAEPPLAAGMVLTLEPGIYVQGWGGVRIEDDVVVTASGAEWLTDVPRAL
jgi:Xaa-Pro aminopeptidase